MVVGHLACSKADANPGRISKSELLGISPDTERDFSSISSTSLLSGASRLVVKATTTTVAIDTLKMLQSYMQMRFGMENVSIYGYGILNVSDGAFLNSGFDISVYFFPGGDISAITTSASRKTVNRRTYPNQALNRHENIRLT